MVGTLFRKKKRLRNIFVADARGLYGAVSNYTELCTDSKTLHSQVSLTSPGIEIALGLSPMPEKLRGPPSPPLPFPPKNSPHLSSSMLRVAAMSKMSCQLDSCKKLADGAAIRLVCTLQTFCWRGRTVELRMITEAFKLTQLCADLLEPRSKQALLPYCIFSRFF